MHKDIATLLNVKITLVAKVASQEMKNIEQRFRSGILFSDVNTRNVEHDVPELSIIGNLGVYDYTLGKFGFQLYMHGRAPLRLSVAHVHL